MIMGRKKISCRNMYPIINLEYVNHNSEHIVRTYHAKHYVKCCIQVISFDLHKNP